MAVARFATQPQGVMTGLFLVDMGATFGQPVAIMGQLRGVTAAVSFLFALAMGALTIRFRHRLLLMEGLMLLTISPLVLGLTSSFVVVISSYCMFGIGLAMTSPMTVAMVGDLLPREKRVAGMGWVMAGLAASFAVGAPIIALMSDHGGWRFALLAYVLPVCAVGLLVTGLWIPNPPQNPHPTTIAPHWIDGFKSIISNRSAAACVVGTALATATAQLSVLYSASFFRERFLASTFLASTIVLVTTSFYTFGSISCSKLVGRVGGLKSLTVMTSLLVAVMLMLYTNVPVLWLSATLAALVALLSGIRFTSSNSLALEQIPQLRGSMMSVSRAADDLGAVIGTVLGGLALYSFGYGALGITLGTMSVAAAIVYYFLAKEAE